ncbi:MAG: AMP-binding protein, partial [Casimicrobiaceae bacterium]
ATLCWNHHAHLEAYFGIPAAGGVMHTLNLRLSPDEIGYIAHDADDRFLIVDDMLLPLARQFLDAHRFERVIVFPFSGVAVPDGFDDYEALLARADPDGLVYAPHAESDPVAAQGGRNTLVLANLAQTLERRGRPDDARLVWQQLAALEPNAATSSSTVAWRPRAMATGRSRSKCSRARRRGPTTTRRSTTGSAWPSTDWATSTRQADRVRHLAALERAGRGAVAGRRGARCGRSPANV